ncbi:MAG: nitroreductase [Dehalococcoidales bacterium]|nr:nitroreductase [Dehalococcoidales bacterium]
MDAIEAILERHSVRDFSSKPVDKETVMKIMEAACRAPSGGNGQPWEVFIAAGNTMEKIRSIYRERAKNPPAGGPTGGPPPQPAYIQARMAQIRQERFELLGLDPNDPASGKVFQEWGARMFGVPVLAIICQDKAIANNLDAGMFIQSVCIAAKGCGVDTFIAGAFVSHQDVLRKELGIPEDLNIITGIGLGYPNEEAVINTYRAPRRPVTEVVRYKD